MLPISTVFCVSVWCTICGYALNYQKFWMRTYHAYIAPLHTTRVQSFKEGAFPWGDWYHYEACFLFTPSPLHTWAFNLRPRTLFICHIYNASVNAFVDSVWNNYNMLSVIIQSYLMLVDRVCFTHKLSTLRAYTFDRVIVMLRWRLDGSHVEHLR